MRRRPVPLSATAAMAEGVLRFCLPGFGVLAPFHLDIFGEMRQGTCDLC